MKNKSKKLFFIFQQNTPQFLKYLIFERNVEKQKFLNKTLWTWRHRCWRQKKLLPNSFFPAPPTFEQDEDDDGNDVNDQQETDAHSWNILKSFIIDLRFE